MTDPASYRPAPGSIPDSPGVYRFRDERGRVIYVGKAKNLRSRLNSYFADFVALHKEVRAEDRALLEADGRIGFLGDRLGDYADTAALIATLDLVISVDTSVAHLAGALGRPVWVMVTHVPDWRWIVGRDDSPWYPTLRLFRQDATRDWAGVVARVEAALGAFLAGA